MTLFGRLSKWAMFLSQFDIVFVPQKAIKGQALANFLPEHRQWESHQVWDVRLEN